jgi:hypothetical protein
MRRLEPMNSSEAHKVESETLGDFARVMQAGTGLVTAAPGKGDVYDTQTGRPGRLNLDQDNVKNGLGQLVLTLVKLLHELLERQAIRRIDAGSLSDADIEKIGVTLMKQAEEIERLRREFNLDEEDLNLDLGPLGKLL